MHVVVLLSVLFASVVAGFDCDVVTRNEIVVEGDVLDIVWQTEDHDNYVFLLSDEGILYRSFSAGKTFNDESARLARSGEVFDGGYSGVNRIYQTADPKKLLFLSHGDWIWVTSNNGKDYELRKTPDGIHFYTLIPHPMKADYILAHGSSGGCYIPPTEEPCYRMAFVSTDFGSSWKKIGSYVEVTSWGNAGHIGYVNDTIYMSRHMDVDPSQKQSSLLWDDVALVKSTDFFASETVLVPEMVGGFIFYESRYMFVAQMASDEALKLLVSTDGGKHIRTAKFPTGTELDEKRYTIISASEHVAMVNVDHSNGYWGHLYTSGDYGDVYSVSLHYNHREPWGHSDVYRLQGIDGVFFANSVKNPEETNPSSMEMITWISFDKGGMWNRLGMPLNDVCDDLNDCNLNLNVVEKHVGLTGHYEYQSRVGPMHSKSNAIGLMVATGKPGSYLLPNSQSINTYISRDAGLRWTKVKDGSYISDFGDHGAIVVMTLSEQDTDEFVFSWNQGKSFETCKFFGSNNYKIDVDSIVSEPSGTGEGFLIYGSRINELGSPEGVVVHLDFSSMHERDCQGETDPNGPESDYEYFIPASSVDGHCVLGAEVAYIRRKAEAECFNPDEMEPVEIRRVCECTQEDYECDIDFERVNGICVRTEGTSPTTPEECPEEGYYYLSSGYRKVPGDVCEGGLQFPHERIKCGGKSSTSAGMIVLYVFLSITCVGLLGAGGVYVQRNGMPAIALPKFNLGMPSLSKTKGPAYREVESDLLMDDFEDDDRNPSFRL